MTTKETKKMDFVLFMQMVAATRGVKPQERLEAFAADMLSIRDGEEPIKSKGLVWRYLNVKNRYKKIS